VRRKELKPRLVIISVHIPRKMLEYIDRLVEEGYYPSRSELIRIAIRELLQREEAKRNRGKAVRVWL